MAKQTTKDYALLALTAEAEKRRKALGLRRYSYGNLVADTTPEERQRIVEDYKKSRSRRKSAEVFVDPEEEPCIPCVLQQVPEE